MKTSNLMCDFGYGPFHVAHIVASKTDCYEVFLPQTS